LMRIRVKYFQGFAEVWRFWHIRLSCFFINDENEKRYRRSIMYTIPYTCWRRRYMGYRQSKRLRSTPFPFHQSTKPKASRIGWYARAHWTGGRLVSLWHMTKQWTEMQRTARICNTRSMCRQQPTQYNALGIARKTDNENCSYGLQSEVHPLMNSME